MATLKLIKKTRSYRLRAALLALLFFLGSTTLVTERVFAWTQLCSGFSACSSELYTTHDYDSNYTNSYWNALAGHNCTNYVGYMLTQNGNAGHGVAMGNAGQWDNTISTYGWGYAMNQTPVIGAIAQWDEYANGDIGSTGHVAYVEDFDSNYIYVSEDNYPSGPYRWRKISRNDASERPTRYLHIADIGNESSVYTKDDLVVHNPSNNSFAVAKSNGGYFIGSGNWLTGWSAGDWTGIGDFNGDGKDDLVVHNPSGNHFSVALSTGSSYTGDGNWHSGWSVGDWAAVGDFNNDNYADIVVHDGVQDKFNVLINNKSGGFSGSTWRTGWSAGDWAGVGDFDNDGYSDIVVHMGTSFNVLKNNKNGGFSGSTWLSGWSSGNWTGIGDFNGDGKDDLVVHNPSGNHFSIAKSTGSSYTGDGNWHSGWSVGDWAGTGDFNGDGYSDIVVHDGSNDKFNVLKNSQSSGFSGSTWLDNWNAGDWAGVGNVNNL